MFKSLLIIFTLLLGQEVWSCDLRYFSSLAKKNSLQITGRLNSKIKCEEVKSRLKKLLEDDLKSRNIQSQTQDLFYIEGHLVSIQIQQLVMSNKRVGQVLIFSLD